MYRPPALQLQGTLADLLRRFVVLPRDQPPAGDPRVCKLLDYLEKRAGRMEANLQQICRELGLPISPNYAARLFKSQVGIGIRAYSKQKRLLAAADRLKRTDAPIKVIAADLGYRDSFGLARSFKKGYHLRPTEFRKRAA
jgi:AraC-like DNA-binding protein